MLMPWLSKIPPLPDQPDEETYYFPEESEQSTGEYVVLGTGIRSSDPGPGLQTTYIFSSDPETTTYRIDPTKR